MPRTARKESSTGIYHVMLRGLNRQQVFLDDEDNIAFIKVLPKCREISGFSLFAYCLMGNHIHLLLRADGEPLGQIMKRIGTRYVYWYNNKYERSGPLFQDRYKSEPVEDQAYFLTVLRYILKNPVRAGLCKRMETYPWSSASDYFYGSGITDTSYAEEMTGRDALLKFLRAKSNDACLDDEQPRIRDSEAQEIILETVGGKNMDDCLEKVTAYPAVYVPHLRDAGLSIRQISRLTGLSFALARK